MEPAIDPDFSLGVREAVVEVCPPLASTGHLDGIRRSVWDALASDERQVLKAG